MSVDYKSKIDKKLENHIIDVKHFKEILYNHNAYIAGGFLLSAITDNSFETSDLDIYVSASNFNALIYNFSTWSDADIMTSFSYPIFKQLSDREGQCSRKTPIYDYTKKCSLMMASEYDHSFFKKNNIKFKTEITLQAHSKKNIKCDIMVVNNGTNVLDVINNFDLTCCQVWYNGYEFNGSHLKDIHLKKAYLNEDYFISLINNNYFIKNRIEKYTKRGFNIEIKAIYKITEKSKVISDIDKFVVKLVINYYITYLQYVVRSITLTRKDVVYIGIAYDYLNMFEYPNFDDNNFKLECKNKCLLDIELRRFNWDRNNIKLLLYTMILKYVNSFNTYSVTELKLNTLLYFGVDYKFVLKNIHSLFNTTLEKIKQYQKIKKSRMQKIVKKMEKFLGKIEEDPLKTFKKYIIKDFKLPFVKKVESIVTKTEIDLALEGTDIIEMEDRTIEEHLKLDLNNVCIIGLKDDNDENIINPNTVNFTNFDYLSIYLKDMNSGWFYKCNDPDSMRDIDKSIAYVKIPLSFTIYIPYYELYDIIRNKYRILFYKKIKEKVENTVSHDNAYPLHPNSRVNYVGASHCQEGSNKTFYNIYKHENSISKSKSDSSNKVDSNYMFKNLKKKNNTKAKSEPERFKRNLKGIPTLNKSKT